MILHFIKSCINFNFQLLKQSVHYIVLSLQSNSMQNFGAHQNDLFKSTTYVRSRFRLTLNIHGQVFLCGQLYYYYKIELLFFAGGQKASCLCQDCLSTCFFLLKWLLETVCCEKRLKTTWHNVSEEKQRAKYCAFGKTLVFIQICLALL